MPRAKTKNEPKRRTIDAWSAVASFDFASGGRIVAGENGGFRVCAWNEAGAVAWHVELMKHGGSSRYNYEVQVAVRDDVVLALAKNDAAIAALDVATGERKTTYEVPKGTRTFALTPDGKRIVLRVSTHTVVCAYPSFEVLATFDAYCNQNGIAISPDGNVLAVAGHEIHIFDLAHLAHVKTFEPPESPWSLTFSASGDHLVTGDSRNMLRLYDASQGFALAAEVGKNRKPTITSVAVSQDGRFVAAANELGTVALHATSTLAALRELKGHDPTQPDTGSRAIDHVAFAPSGELVVGAPPKKEPAGLTLHTLG